MLSELSGYYVEERNPVQMAKDLTVFGIAVSYPIYFEIQCSTRYRELPHVSLGENKNVLPCSSCHFYDVCGKYNNLFKIFFKKKRCFRILKRCRHFGESYFTRFILEVFLFYQIDNIYNYKYVFTCKH